MYQVFIAGTNPETIRWMPVANGWRTVEMFLLDDAEEVIEALAAIHKQPMEIEEYSTGMNFIWTPGTIAEQYRPPEPFQERSFQIEKQPPGNWYLQVLDDKGEITESRLISALKSNANKALDAAEQAYEQEKNLAELKELLPFGTKLVMVLKHVYRTSGFRYNVFIAHQGQVTMLDRTIDAAGIATYKGSKEGLWGLETNYAQTLCDSLGRNLYNDTRAFTFDEVL